MPRDDDDAPGGARSTRGTVNDPPTPAADAADEYLTLLLLLLLLLLSTIALVAAVAVVATLVRVGDGGRRPLPTESPRPRGGAHHHFTSSNGSSLRISYFAPLLPVEDVAVVPVVVPAEARTVAALTASAAVAQKSRPHAPYKRQFALRLLQFPVSVKKARLPLTIQSKYIVK